MTKLCLAIAMLAVPAAAAAQAPVWQVTAPPPIALLFDHAAPIQVSVTEQVTNPRLTHSTLRDAGTAALLSTQFLSLCEKPGGTCVTPKTLAKGAHGLFIVVGDGFREHGEFKGSVYLQVDQKLEPTPVELTVYATSYGAWAFGLVAIILGVALSVWSTVVIRQSSARLDALAPAALLADRLRADKAEVDRARSVTGFTFPAINAQLDAILRDLSEEALDSRNFLPRRWGRPLGGDAAGEAYRAYLAEKGDLVAAVTATLLQGLPRILEEWQRNPQHKAIQDALKSLDALAPATTKPADVPAAVAAVLTKMDDGLLPPGAVGMAQGGGGPQPPAIRSSVEIRTQQGRYALVAWSVWAIVTIAAGAAALIVSNNAFGVPLDYFKCFFWGLGIQSAGQQVSQLSPGGVASSFKLSMPT